MLTKAHRLRLARLIKQMRPGSVMVLSSPAAAIRNRDVHYPFRNSSDLLYLTGVNEENFSLVITSDADINVYSREKNPDRERWVGPCLGPQKIARDLGLSTKNAHSDTDFWDDLTHHLANRGTLYYPFGTNETLDARMLKMVNQAAGTARGGGFAPHVLVHPKEILHEMRLVKDREEIALMKQAAQISARSHKALMLFTREASRHGNLHEYQAKAFLESQFLGMGSEQLAYPSIVAGGANATILHYEHAAAKIKKKDLLLVDAGCEWHGYASDITRTFPVGGKFTPAQRDSYQVVLDAQKAAIRRSKPGATLLQIHQAAVKKLVDGLWDMGLLKRVPVQSGSKTRMVRPKSKQDVLKNHQYRHFYMHLTSHFLGLDVHDVGSYYDGKKHRKLKPGMAFTIEPGLYFPMEYDFVPKEFKGIGIRIEDDIVLTRSGAINLSEEAPKEIKEIEALA